MHEPGKLLTPEELAKRLVLSVFTLKAWRVRGVGPRWTKAGSRIRYPLAQVEAWETANGHGVTRDVCPSCLRPYTRGGCR